MEDIIKKSIWKGLPSWVKGGVIFIFLSLVISIIFSKGICTFGGCPSFVSIFNIPILLFAVSTRLISLNINLSQESFVVILSIISTLLYFIIGSFIGLLVGKIKSIK